MHQQFDESLIWTFSPQSVLMRAFCWNSDGTKSDSANISTVQSRTNSTGHMTQETTVEVYHTHVTAEAPQEDESNTTQATRTPDDKDPAKSGHEPQGGSG